MSNKYQEFVEAPHDQLAEQSAHSVKWRKCVIQGLEVDPRKAPPMNCKAKFRYNCFEQDCTFKDYDLALDSYIKHLADRHQKIHKRPEHERNSLYLSVRANH